MSRKKRKDRLQAKDKITHKMTRDGLVEVNETKGETARISQRGQDFSLQGEPQQQEAWGGRSEARRNRRRRQKTPDKTYSQVGNTSEPDASRLQTDGDLHRYEASQAVNPERDADYQPESTHQADNPQDTVLTPRHTGGDLLDDRQFIHGGGHRQKQQLIYDVKEDSTVTAKEESLAPAPTQYEAEKPRNPRHNATEVTPAGEPRQARLRFEKTEQSAPDKGAQQHGTRYQRRFQNESEKRDETPATEDAPSADASQKETRDSPVSVDVSNVQQPDKSKLQFSQDESTPSDVAPPVSKKLEKARGKAAKTSANLDAARNKLPTKRRAGFIKEFDAETGKPARRLQFEKEVKTQREHLKGPLPLRPVKFGANAAVGYAHKKIYQVEHENVGTQATHKAELMAEGVARSALRFHKTAPYSRVAKLERKTTKANMKLSYRQALEDNPKLKSNPLSRMMQKRKIKKQYAKAAREAKRAAKTAQRSGSLVAKAGKSLLAIIKRNPKTAIILALLALLVLVIMSSVSSCSNLAGGGFSTILMSSYVAEDKDIDDAELAYSEWETDLQLQINNAESDHPGYDEYRYNVDDISHNPFELMAYLTARYQDFTFAAVEADLREIFAEQYQLSFLEEVEIRYNDPDDDDDDGDLEPYEWYILNINLTSRSFTDVILPRLGADEQEHYDLLMETHGNRQYILNPFDFDWLPYVTSYYGWRVHPITGIKDYHKGIDIAVPVGTPILAGHDGVVTAAAYDADGFGWYIAIEGKDNLVSKYAHCDTLMASVGQEVKEGDVIAKSGNTGNSTGPHLHLEVLRNGQYLNPLYFAEGATGGSAPGTPGGPVIPDYPGEPMGDGSFAALMEEAQKHLGKPYVFGASGPDTFDCSGFVCYVLNQSGVASVGRTTATGLFHMCTPVSPANAKPGDLIFFSGTYSTPNACSHIGIYIGNGMMIHAGNPVQYASINDSYWQEHFYAFGRLS